MFHCLLKPLANSATQPVGTKCNSTLVGRCLGQSLVPDLSAVPALVICTSLAINILGLCIIVVLDTSINESRSYLLGWEAAKLGRATLSDATGRFFWRLP